jgi:DNA mismatch endonuclease (patch repair protein)
MSNISSKDTKIEVLVRKFLFSKGFRYRKNDRRYPGRPDIVLPKYNTVIFIHGCFWHSHDGCPYFVMPKSNIEFWQTKLDSTRKRDTENKDKLCAAGWHVIVVWGCELRKPVQEKRLQQLLEEIISP